MATTTQAQAPLSLLSDVALVDDGEKLDGLGFDVYADVLARAAQGTRGPFTIGVFGEWGAGKTSLMRMIKQKLDPDPEILTVWFNAWRYEKEKHLIIPLVATIVRELEKNKSFTDKLKDGGKELITALRAFIGGSSFKVKVTIPEVVEAEFGGDADKMVARYDKLSADPLLEMGLYDEAYTKLAQLANSGKIVVFIDDLDRCFPDNSIALLESIKLVLAQPGFIFILGVARSVLEDYLQHRYAVKYGVKNFTGRAYLDKMVQLPFHIPRHDERMSDFSQSLLGQLDEPDREVFKDILPIIGAACGCNPRTTIRFVNNLLIDRAISSALSGDIPLGFFAITRSLQQHWGEVYAQLSHSNDLCTTLHAWEESDLEHITYSENKDYAFMAMHLKENTHLRQLLYSPQGKAWLMDHNLRTASITFLQMTRKDELIRWRDPFLNNFTNNSDKYSVDIPQILRRVDNFTDNSDKYSVDICPSVMEKIRDYPGSSYSRLLDSISDLSIRPTTELSDPNNPMKIRTARVFDEIVQKVYNIIYYISPDQHSLTIVDIG